MCQDLGLFLDEGSLRDPPTHRVLMELTRHEVRNVLKSWRVQEAWAEPAGWHKCTVCGGLAQSRRNDVKISKYMRFNAVAIHQAWVKLNRCLTTLWNISISSIFLLRKRDYGCFHTLFGWFGQDQGIKRYMLLHLWSGKSPQEERQVLKQTFLVPKPNLYNVTWCTAIQNDFFP